jgi:hypothetical protein
MKKLALLIAFLSLTTAAYANNNNGNVQKLWDAQTIAGTGTTVVTRGIPVANVKEIGVWHKLNQAVPATPSHTSTSAVNLYMEASYDDTSANYATVSTIYRNVNTVSTVNTITFPNMKYVRFRATGVTGQGTDSTITAYVFTQE